MPTTTDRRRSSWPTKGFAGLAGVIGGAGWAAIGEALPAVAVMLVAVTGLVWWWATHRKGPQCAIDCGCSKNLAAKACR